MPYTNLKTDYPIKFNTTVIPFPSGWEENPNVVENTFQTEAGTDKVEVIRYDKLSVSVSMKCLSSLVTTLGSFSRMDSFTLKRYNPTNDTYEERTVRMRGFKYKLVPKSQDLGATKGIWEVSFNLEEF